jgi:transcriptional regulator with XRE-family HTH domain
VTVASRIRSLRQAQGLTQKQLSARSDVNAASISRIENGLTPRVDALVRLARALDVDPGLLVGDYAETAGRTA